MTDADRMQLQALRIQLIAAVAQIDCMTGTPEPASAGNQPGDELPEFYPMNEPVGSAIHP